MIHNSALGSALYQQQCRMSDPEALMVRGYITFEKFVSWACAVRCFSLSNNCFFFLNT